jgi:dynein heavy chain
LNPNPEVHGLHDNAEITNNQSMTLAILTSIISIQPKSSSAGGKSRDQIIVEISQDLAAKTPAPFDLEMVSQKFPTEYTESMNTVLFQEVIRYNKLLVVMAEMLINVQKAVKGEVVMSEELDKMSTSLFNNQVPLKWAGVGFLSLKPLASWT